MAISQSERQKKELQKLIESDPKFKDGEIIEVGYVNDNTEEDSEGIFADVIMFYDECYKEYSCYYTIYKIRGKLVNLLVRIKDSCKGYVSVHSFIENGESGEFIFDEKILQHPEVTRVFYSKKNRKNKKFKIEQFPQELWNLNNEERGRGRLVKIAISDDTNLTCLKNFYDYCDPCISTWFSIGTGSTGHLAVVGETFEQCEKRFIELISKGYSGFVNIK